MPHSSCYACWVWNTHACFTLNLLLAGTQPLLSSRRLRRVCSGLQRVLGVPVHQSTSLWRLTRLRLRFRYDSGLKTCCLIVIKWCYTLCKRLFIVYARSVMSLLSWYMWDMFLAHIWCSGSIGWELGVTCESLSLNPWSASNTHRPFDKHETHCKL